MAAEDPEVRDDVTVPALQAWPASAELH